MCVCTVQLSDIMMFCGDYILIKKTLLSVLVFTRVNFNDNVRDNKFCSNICVSLFIKDIRFYGFE